LAWLAAPVPLASERRFAAHNLLLNPGLKRKDYSKKPRFSDEINETLVESCAKVIAASQQYHCCWNPLSIRYFKQGTAESSAAFKGLTTMILTHLLGVYRQWRRYNDSIRELNRLGDRELADIGITRGDIPRVAWESSEH